MTGYLLQPIGHVESTLTDRASAPRQPDEHAPDAWLVLDPQYASALVGLDSGTDVLLFTWFDQADRTTVTVHPRGDTTRPKAGVFVTRSPDRPNPIGLHTVHLLAIEGTRVHVGALEALNGTPILDVKPILTENR